MWKLYGVDLNALTEFTCLGKLSFYRWVSPINSLTGFQKPELRKYKKDNKIRYHSLYIPHIQIKDIASKIPISMS